MAAICILNEFHPHKNKDFLQKAEMLTPQLIRTEISPVRILKPDVSAESLGFRPLRRGDSIILDFGEHYVGYLELELSYQGSHPDAPAYLYLRFAEQPQELAEDISHYNGWIGKGWIQEEYIHVDTLPARLKLPRRYAFRYLEIRVIDVSMKYSLIIKKSTLTAVSAVSMNQWTPVDFGEPILTQIDRTSVKTLCNCMQNVFEDGPKRDRRMWLGDFRLEAKTNYETFQNYDLVKRCLYLFGGLTFNEGKIPACIFIEPEPDPDDTYLFDYALLYGSILADYYEASKDKETLQDLYPVALQQIEIGLSYLDETGVIPDHSNEFWCFVDWGDGLNTQAASLAILIYALRCGIRLAEYMRDIDSASWMEKEIKLLRQNAIEAFWDEEQHFFVSGAERQVSWATQIWMILAEVFPIEKNRELLLHTMETDPEIRMVTPYMYHHYIDALIQVNEKAAALEEIKCYWGGMIRDGADTFWEVYNPENPSESPYGSTTVNSCCHAWSCTPAYFLRKYFHSGAK